MILDFLKYCLGNKADMSEVIANMDWRELYALAKKQAIIVFCFDGIERLGNEYPEELRNNPIGQDLLMAWMGNAQQIRRQNMKVNAAVAKLYAQLRNDGLRCCILKGQGNALMYPSPYSRTSGDIDVWINASRGCVIEYAKEHFKLGNDVRYLHLETTLDRVPVELHFFPSYMNNPFFSARLQKWFKKNADLQCSNAVNLPDDAGEIAVPTTAFNVIYQLGHLYHHFFDEGIGLRQVIDYYYVINNWHTDYIELTDLAVLQRELKHLGLFKFAGAVMYVLHEVLGLSDDKLIVPMDEKQGRLLLYEILDGGNFGRYFTKYGHFTQQCMAKKTFFENLAQYALHKILSC